LKFRALFFLKLNMAKKILLLRHIFIRFDFYINIALFAYALLLSQRDEAKRDRKSDRQQYSARNPVPSRRGERIQRVSRFLCRRNEYRRKRADDEAEYSKIGLPPVIF
jgi:hypothetical protein